MKLPADAIIAPAKITDYLLRRLDENDKSAFLAQAGYALEDPERLLADIREQLLPLDADLLGPFDYGAKFRIRGALRGPNGKELRVTSVWATIKASGQTRFVTLYPDKP